MKPIRLIEDENINKYDEALLSASFFTIKRNKFASVLSKKWKKIAKSLKYLLVYYQKYDIILVR